MKFFLLIILGMFSGSIKSQYVHEFHITENLMVYKPIINLKKLLLSKNKIDSLKVKQTQIYINNMMNRGLFSLDSSSNLRVAKHIDREELCPPKEMIRQSKLCGSPQICCNILEFHVAHPNDDTQSFFLRFFVDDENDNLPIFPIVPSPYFIVEENKPIGFKIPLPKAQDLDNQTYGVAFYKLKTPFKVGNASSFELSVESRESAPFLMIINSLDREKIPLYTFDLVAVDGVEGNRNTGATEITIRVRDINDNAPQFEKHIYMISMKENSIFEPIFDIIVTDEDEDENGRIELRLSSNVQELINTMFTMDIIEQVVGRTRAQIRAISSIDYEQPPHHYEFKIIAQDRGRNSLSSTATGRIQILNVNDISPKIVFLKNGEEIRNVFSIDEGTPQNKMLIYIQVSDADSPTNQLQCTLRSANNVLILEETPFIHPANLYKQYLLRTNQKIDRESIESILVGSKLIITIQCSDYDTLNPLTSNSSIFMIINDINDNAPQFTQQKYYGSIMENTVNQEVVINPPVNATDRDVSFNAKISYYLQNINTTYTDANSFRINPDTGRIYNKQPFDFETKDIYKFLVIAKDHGETAQLSSSAVVIVRIRDQNDNAPRFESNHYAFTITENVKIGYLVGTVKATDIDNLPENKDLRYHIKLDLQNRAADLIALDYLTGQIRTTQAIDREKIASITFIIEARNPTKIQVGLIQDAMVVITILNVNDCPPTFRLIDPSKSRLIMSLEQLNQGQICEPIPYVIEDADDGSSGTGTCCILKLKDDMNGLLSLSPDSQGVVCVNKIPEKLKSLQVTIVASDNHGNDSLENEATFTILLKNDPSLVTKRKSNPETHTNPKQDDRHNEVQQMILIIAFAVLAALFFVAVAIVVFFGPKKCYKFSFINNDVIEEEKNNLQDSELVSESKSVMRKNEFDTFPSNEIMSGSPMHFYNALQHHPMGQTIQSPLTLQSCKTLESGFDRNSTDSRNPYQYLKGSNETYQIINFRKKGSDQYDNIRSAFMENQQSPLISDCHSVPDIFQGRSTYSKSHMNLAPMTVATNSLTSKCNQTTFV